MNKFFLDDFVVKLKHKDCMKIFYYIVNSYRFFPSDIFFTDNYDIFHVKEFLSTLTALGILRFRVKKNCYSLISPLNPDGRAIAEKAFYELNETERVDILEYIL